MKFNNLGKCAMTLSPITIGAWPRVGPLFFDVKPDGHSDPNSRSLSR